MSPFVFEEATIAEMQAAMAAGQITAHALAERYLARIAVVDGAVNAVLALNPDALDIAAARDAERAAGQVRGPLHGIPVLIKGNIDSADKMTTTAGSLALAGSHAPRDAFIVARLREAGAVILGKANLSEWANFRSTRSVSGWSSEGGQTRNPYALNRNPSGSSSGSAAAVSANLCAVAVGTETDGSIVSPSSACGIVGIKPTVGLVSRSGIIPIAHSQDTAGPMARTVADAALLLGVLAGMDTNDAATAAAADHVHNDYAQFLATDGLNGARIGVPRQFFGRDSRVDQLMEQAISLIQQQGAVIVDPVSLPSRATYGDAELTVLLYEFKADLNTYLAERGADAPVKNMADIIAFNRTNRADAMPFFEQELMEAAQQKGPLTDADYQDALALCRQSTQADGIDKALDEHQLDALIGPSGGPAWLIDPVNGDHYNVSSSSPAAVSGYPSVTVPMGFVHGLPVGISFFGGAWSEPTLLRLAYAFEQATQVRRPPRFLASAILDTPT